MCWSIWPSCSSIRVSEPDAREAVAAAVVTGGFPSRRARGPRGARLRRFLRRFGRDRAAVAGTAPTVIAALVGLLIGLPAAYAGGMLDLVAMRVMDILFAFPMVLLAVAVAGVLGPGIINQVVAIAVVLIPYTTRVVRNVVVAERQREYVEAARAQGANARRIIGRHLLPNVLGPLVAYSSSMLGLMIVAGSGLSFLGLGVQPPTPDWGTMVASGKNVLQVAPHVAAIPGFVIMTVAVAFNYIGDGFRDAMMVR